MTHSRKSPQDKWRNDARVMGLVGLVHGTSHFFHLLLPPVFPWFMREFGLTYSQLGFLVSLFFLISGVGQALSGFLVDRFGARPVLLAALSSFVLAALSAALAQGYVGLAVAAALAGLGNAPFHPVDFTILNRRVSPARLGHAYSVHGICGNLGWAASPLITVGLIGATGSIRVAYVVVALLALVVLGVVLFARDSLNERAPDHASARSPRPAPAGVLIMPAIPVIPTPLAEVLRRPAVWLCFAFLFLTTCALGAIQSFAAPALQQLHDLAPRWAALVVSGYMVCGAVGMVGGGFLLASGRRAEPVLAVTLLGSALLLGAAALPDVSALGSLALVSLAGLGTGLASPSRDTLIRQSAPAGASGRVYGLVYSGLDLGFAVAAPIFGALLDAGHPAWVLGGAALALLAAVLTAGLTRTGQARDGAPATGMPTRA